MSDQIKYNNYFGSCEFCATSDLHEQDLKSIGLPRSKINRAIPIEMINERNSYDVKRYIELLTEICNSVTEPFGLRLTLPPTPVSSLQFYPVIGEGITKY